MKIKNFDNIAKSESRRDLLKIVDSGLNEIDSSWAIDKNIEVNEKEVIIKEISVSLGEVENIYIVAVGKCAFVSAKSLEDKLGDRLKAGIALDVHNKKPVGSIKYLSGDHPFPSEKNIEASKEILDFLDKTTDRDLVINIISGGGSTLLCQPTGFDYKLEVKIIEHLFAHGARIDEINTIRKHISYARGGGLAKAAFPSKVISLIFSDVVGDNLGFVSSGPTVFDTTTIDDAKKILAKYNINDECGFSDEYLIETPKDKKYFENVTNLKFISNEDALNKMKTVAESLGFKAKIVTRELEGVAREVGENIAYEIVNENDKTVLLYGGETTVKVKGKGKGGRNQEVVLSALNNLPEGIVISSIASDGYDNTDHAGALCDIITKSCADDLGLMVDLFLEKNDSYNFFKRVGDFIITDHTGSNVSDLIIAMKK